MAPPCSSFAVAKDPAVRDRKHVLGKLDLDDESARYVAKHNEIVTFASTLALVAHARNVPYAIENPSDRGDVTSDAYWAEHQHAAAIWLTPAMQLLRDCTAPRELVFPQCAFGSDAQKFTTVWTTSATLAAAFSHKICTHIGKHADVAHAYLPDGSYRSAQYAAYPHAMNAAIADAIAGATVSPSLQTAVSVTTKIDGLHPVQAAPLNDTRRAATDTRDEVTKQDGTSSELSPKRLEAARLYKRDKQRRRRKPIRFEQASTGLRARAATHAAMAMRAGTGTRDEDTIQLYDDAADIADVPLHVHEAHDVPESVLPAHCVRLARPASDVVYPPGTSVLDGATEVYIVQRRDADGDVHPALRAAASKRHALDRKTVVYYTADGVAHAIEPKGIKEALASLQHEQWRLAIERELDNLHGHGAFHLVPKAEALRQGKRIMRMTWVKSGVESGRAPVVKRLPLALHPVASTRCFGETSSSASDDAPTLGSWCTKGMARCIDNCPKCDSLVAGWAEVEAAKKSKATGEMKHKGCRTASLIAEGYGYNSAEVKASRNELKARWQQGLFQTELQGRQKMTGKKKMPGGIITKRPIDAVAKKAGKASSADGKGDSSSGDSEDLPLAARAAYRNQKKQRCDEKTSSVTSSTPKFMIGQYVIGQFIVEEDGELQAFIGIVEKQDITTGSDSSVLAPSAAFTRAITRLYYPPLPW